LYLSPFSPRLEKFATRANLLSARNNFLGLNRSDPLNSLDSSDLPIGRGCFCWWFPRQITRLALPFYRFMTDR